MSNNFIYRLDWWLILIYLFLVIVGIVNVYSATYTESLESIFDFSQLAGKQLLFLFISIFLGAIILGINIKFFEHFATSSYITSILLLIGLFFFGKTVSGATSWYDLGGFSLQPSEFAKIGTAMMIAGYLGKFQSDLKPTVIFLSFPTKPIDQKLYKTGVKVRLCETDILENKTISGIKHLNRLDSVVARSEWDANFFEGLFVDKSGNLLEGTMTNIFMLKKNMIYSFFEVSIS